MTTLSEKNKYYNTQDADAVASDIRSGKTAYVNGGKVTGNASVTPLDVTNNVFLDYTVPSGPIGSHQLNPANDALVLDSAATVSVRATGNISDGSLFSVTASSTQEYLRITGLTAKTRNNRMYRLDGYLGNINLSTYTAPVMRFNWVDASNYWEVAYTWDAASSFRFQIWECTSGTKTERAYYNFSTSIDVPLHYTLTVYDHGDYVKAGAFVYEPGNHDDQAYSIDYYQSSRNNKTGTGVAVLGQGQATYTYFRSVKVWDV